MSASSEAALWSKVEKPTWPTWARMRRTLSPPDGDGTQAQTDFNAGFHAGLMTAADFLIGLAGKVEKARAEAERGGGRECRESVQRRAADYAALRHNHRDEILARRRARYAAAKAKAAKGKA